MCIINITGSVAYQQQRVPDMSLFIRHLPEIPDGDPNMMRNQRRNSAWNPREVGFDRRSEFERRDSLRTMQNQPRRMFHNQTFYSSNTSLSKIHDFLTSCGPICINNVHGKTANVMETACKGRL